MIWDLPTPISCVENVSIFRFIWDTLFSTKTSFSLFPHFLDILIRKCVLVFVEVFSWLSTFYIGKIIVCRGFAMCSGKVCILLNSLTWPVSSTDWSIQLQKWVKSRHCCPLSEALWKVMNSSIIPISHLPGLLHAKGFKDHIDRKTLPWNEIERSNTPPKVWILAKVQPKYVCTHIGNLQPLHMNFRGAFL